MRFIPVIPCPSLFLVGQEKLKNDDKKIEKIRADFDYNIPEPLPDPILMSKRLAINMRILSEALIEMTSKMKVGMNEKELTAIRDDIFDKYNIPKE